MQSSPKPKFNSCSSESHQEQAQAPNMPMATKPLICISLTWAEPLLNSITAAIVACMVQVPMRNHPHGEQGPGSHNISKKKVITSSRSTRTGSRWQTSRTLYWKESTFATLHQLLQTASADWADQRTLKELHNQNSPTSFKKVWTFNQIFDPTLFKHLPKFLEHFTSHYLPQKGKFSPSINQAQPWAVLHTGFHS